MAGLPLGQSGGHLLGRRQGRPRRRDIAFPHQDLGLAGMSQGETGIGGDGAVIGLDRAGIQGQRQIGRLDIGVPRGGGGGGQGKAVSICQHENPPAVPEIDIGRRGQ